MNPRAQLTAREQQDLMTNFNETASSECSCMQSSTSENYCYGHQELESTSTFKSSSITMRSANEVVANSKKEYSSPYSLQMPPAEYRCGTPPPQIIPHTKTIGIIFTTTPDETSL